MPAMTLMIASRPRTSPSPSVLIMPGKTFEDAFAGRPTGAVFLWTPGTPAFRQLPGTELAADNGIETSPDDREFFVVSTTTKKIVAFARSNPGAPLRVAQLAEFGPDNVRWTSDDRLITAGMIDNEPVVRRAAQDRSGNQVLARIHRRDDRSENDGRDRDCAGTRNAVVYGNGDRDDRRRRSLARIVQRGPAGLSPAEAMKPCEGIR